MNPALCRELIVRSVRRGPLAVTLEYLDALPLHEALTATEWGKSLNDLPDDCFQDRPFKGTLADAIWRSYLDGRWLDPIVGFGG